jgi:hypothetical protein
LILRSVNSLYKGAAAAGIPPLPPFWFLLKKTSFAHSIDSRYNHGVFFQVSIFSSGQKAVTLLTESRLFFLSVGSGSGRHKPLEYLDNEAVE